MDKLSQTLESYLDAIYENSQDGGARLTDVAKRMGVNKSTANAAMLSLAEKGLISTERYGNITLTDSGLKIAQFVTQKHKIVFEFFSAVLGLDAQISDRDACAIEHVISSDAIIAMQAQLAKNK